MQVHVPCDPSVSENMKKGPRNSNGQINIMESQREKLWHFIIRTITADVFLSLNCGGYSYDDFIEVQFKRCFQMNNEQLQTAIQATTSYAQMTIPHPIHNDVNLGCCGFVIESDLAPSFVAKDSL